MTQQPHFYQCRATSSSFNLILSILQLKWFCFDLISSISSQQSNIIAVMSLKLSWKQIVIKVESSKRNLDKNKQKRPQASNLNPSLPAQTILASGIQQSNQRQNSHLKRDISMNEVIQAARIQLQQQRRIVVHPLQLSSKGRIFENSQNQNSKSSSTAKNLKRRAIRSLISDSEDRQKSPIFVSSLHQKRKDSSQLKNDLISHQTKERNSNYRKNQSIKGRKYLSIEVEKDKIRQTDATKTQQSEPVSSFNYKPICLQDSQNELKEAKPKILFEFPSQTSSKLSFGMQKNYSSPINLIRRTKLPQRDHNRDGKLNFFDQSFIDIQIHGEGVLNRKRTIQKAQKLTRVHSKKPINPFSNLLIGKDK